MIELPVKPLENRPFDAVLAKAGAPITTNFGFPVRIICWNRANYQTKDDIVALVRRQGSSIIEEAAQFDKNGEHHGGSGAMGNLVMAPVIYVDGKGIFNGETVYSESGEPVVIYFENFPTYGKDNPNRFRLNPPPIEFEGKPLHLTDKIWSRKSSADSWELVNCSDNWADKPGIKESHFAAIKRNEGREMVLQCYTRKSPHSTVLEGKELQVGDLLWYTHPTSKGKSFTLDLTILNMIREGTAKLAAFTRVPIIKVENWQARVTTGKSQATAFWGDTYPSEQDCKDLAPSAVPLGYQFVKAEKVSEHWQ